MHIKKNIRAMVLMGIFYTMFFSAFANNLECEQKCRKIILNWRETDQLTWNLRRTLLICNQTVNIEFEKCSLIPDLEERIKCTQKIAEISKVCKDDYLDKMEACATSKLVEYDQCSNNCK